MIRIEDLCRYTSFRNEPFEVHSCLTYALLSRRFSKIRRIILDRIANIATTEEIVVHHLEKVLDLYEIAVLLHDIGKLLPVYPLDKESNFFGHEFFSFYILQKVFTDQEIANYLNMDLNALKGLVYVALIPVLLHHSAHRWALEGKIVRDFRRIVIRSKHSVNDLDEYLRGLTHILKRACLCIERLDSLCKIVVNKVHQVVSDIIRHRYENVLQELEHVIDNIANPYSLSPTLIGIKISEVTTPILVALLQLSDRLAAKIIRHGELRDLDIRAFILLSS